MAEGAAAAGDGALEDERDPEAPRLTQVQNLEETRPWLLVDNDMALLALGDDDDGHWPLLPITGAPGQEVVVCGPGAMVGRVEAGVPRWRTSYPLFPPRHGRDGGGSLHGAGPRGRGQSDLALRGGGAWPVAATWALGKARWAFRQGPILGLLVASWATFEGPGTATTLRSRLGRRRQAEGLDGLWQSVPPPLHSSAPPWTCVSGPWRAT